MVQGLHDDQFPVAVYDTSEKKLIMIFKSGKICCQILLKSDSSGVTSRINNKVVLKPTKTCLDVPITLRYATQDQQDKYMTGLDIQEKGVVLDIKYLKLGAKLVLRKVLS